MSKSLTTNSAPVDGECLSVAVTLIFRSPIDVNNFQIPFSPLQICSLSIICYSFSTFSLIIRKLIKLTEKKQRERWPFIMIFFMNRERKMGERKIDVTATLRHAPSTGAEFVVSAGDHLDHHTNL